MTTGPVALCMSCKHRNWDDPAFSCAAFPKGIPQDILDWKVDHRKPYSGDNGVQYEPDGPALA